MKRILRFLLLPALLCVTAMGLQGQTLALPLQLNASYDTWNYESRRGVPLSAVVGNPVGSDGRLAVGTGSYGSANTYPTAKQFQGVAGLGGGFAVVNSKMSALSNSVYLTGTNAFSSTVVQQMGLPSASVNSTIVMVLRRSAVGGSFFARGSTLNFGSEVPPPSTDENGLSLSGSPLAYWVAKPYTNVLTAGYYWSPNAQKVYAIQSGPLRVQWLTQSYTTTKPANYDANPAAYAIVDGNYFKLYTASYVVSGSTVKTPRKMFWNQQSFTQTGKTVSVPAGQVGAINIVYNNNFPQTVSEMYKGPGYTSPTAGSTNQTLQELRTLWYDAAIGTINAYNQEGRVFVELLGDLNADGATRAQLGFEIVDVYKVPSPQDVVVDLGDPLLPPSPGTDLIWEPSPSPNSSLYPFTLLRDSGSGKPPTLYAIQETQNLNDYTLYWMETGVAGLKWPATLGRYQMVWPKDVTRYSHYVRPLVSTEAEAKLTAVALATTNAPTIDFQDALDQPRAKLTEDSGFYTFLDVDHPAHRTLLHYLSGDKIYFERVFSWLDVNLKSGVYPANDPVVSDLTGWSATTRTVTFSDPLTAPRVVTLAVNVGERIVAPTGESGAAGSYLAGHVHRAAGTSYNPTAYQDPLTAGFEAANAGAIIPVNAIPGANTLEIWWFRSGKVNGIEGFGAVNWPSVLGRYTIQWPTSPDEIVLASNQGSGTLDASQQAVFAKGWIYAQNDPTQDGYNPNEEHAIVSGGTAYATRDDLNLRATTTPAVLTGTGATYSSDPCVLVQYVATDGRPAMKPFKVLREKASAGYVFDYVATAGRLLPAPMPLPLLGMPVEGSGDAAVNYNSEPSNTSNDLPVNWNSSTSSSGAYGHYRGFTYRDRKQADWVYRGPHAGWPALAVGTYASTTPTNGGFSVLTTATAVVGQAYALTFHGSRPAENLTLSTTDTLPAGLAISTNLSIRGTPTAATISAGVSLPLVVKDNWDGSQVTFTLTLKVVASGGTAVTQGALVITSVNPYTGTTMLFSNRPPVLATSPTAANSFTMRYMYKTSADFAWPGFASPPAEGSIVPYLRAGSPGSYTGGTGGSKTNTALNIVYRPVWPVKDGGQPLPTIPYGQTLVKPVNGLPGIGDWKTARVLYQQSVALNLAQENVSVVLHDPTRAKTASLTNFGLTAVPSSVRTESYQGKVYFPNLPPHLGKRLYFDPNVGAKGSLVLVGKYQQETFGQSYLHLNVLRGSDLTTALGLCPSSDTVNKSKWDTAITGLSTAVETFDEDPAVPGSYGVNPAKTVNVGEEALAEVTSDNVAVDSYALSATGPGGGYVTLVEAGGNPHFTQPGDPVALHVVKVGGSLYTGEIKVISAENPLSEFMTFQHTPDLAGKFTEFDYEWKIAAPVGGFPPSADDTMSQYQSLTAVAADLPRYLMGGAGVRVLSDNYVTLRYRPKNTSHPLYNTWSAWTPPQLAEGWIKRVLAGINPFNQRTKDLFNAPVNTDSSILTQAGHRWEGDVALNIDTINSYGLIEIYETVLRRGKALSIESGYNYGPANDALLLAAGYLNDLYMMTGNEAWADAANPTIGIGTADRTYGSVATSLFSFKGQEPTLLEEELALLRGRDDSLLPGVQTAPVYNRLVWNYTRGIDAGEVIYALNYNILDQNKDGVVNAADAAILFPQAHGDALGHYLTAIKGYYTLLLNSNFDWVPRPEAVSVLGQPVSVDYQDERKFAAAAAGVGRAGRQVFDLTWRRDYQAEHRSGWSHFRTTQANTQRSFTNLAGVKVNPVRYWGADHWASRAGQGQYVNWLVGNAILPDHDPDPTHAGSIQQIDRTTVPELLELSTQLTDLQVAMDLAEGGMTPLGLPANAVALDLDPNAVVGNGNSTHFEQIYGRAKVALNNAVVAFDDAKGVTQLMRSEQDSLQDLKTALDQQELAFTHQLIELYGTPYADDVGPGKTWKQGYTGPDLVHYMYADMPQLTFPGLGTSPTSARSFKIDTQPFGVDYEASDHSDFKFYLKASSADYLENNQYLTYTLDESGDLVKPESWTGRRTSPGKLQEAIGRIQLARNEALGALNDDSSMKRKLDLSAAFFQSMEDIYDRRHAWDLEKASGGIAIKNILFLKKIYSQAKDSQKDLVREAAVAMGETLPRSLIVGVANGGDMLSAARGAVLAQAVAAQAALDATDWVKSFVIGAATNAREAYFQLRDVLIFQPLMHSIESRQAVADLDSALQGLQAQTVTINQKLQALHDALENYRSLVAQGDRLQAEREVARQRSAALIQGYRTRDAAFRVFRNEKLERYKSLFDLAARYSFLAAKAYDYETGLLNTAAGQRFVNRIINSRALGVVQNGEPQYAGSNTGDPGLSSALAEMKADWDVLKGRLGFNNPDAYGTTVSLRTERFRILPTTNGITDWQDLLQRNRKADILTDPDVVRNCLQVAGPNGLAVPGIVIEFSTTIADGYNLFGQPFGPGDHAFNTTAFATKIFSAGVALDGYRGMDVPAANGFVGGVSPSDPSGWFLDPQALGATPYVYLIPVGSDSMRSPPLGDASEIRTWDVADVAVPLPFNIGASTVANGGFSTASSTLSDTLFAVRKHQAFRPVPSASYFSPGLYGNNGTLQRSQYTNNRLIGRSAWNSRWKLVIPGSKLLNDPNEGLDRFIKTVSDIKLHFVTYSYSGN